MVLRWGSGYLVVWKRVEEEVKSHALFQAREDAKLRLSEAHAPRPTAASPHS